MTLADAVAPGHRARPSPGTPDGMTRGPSVGPGLATIVLMALPAAVLVVLVLSHAFMAYLATSRPHAASWLGSRHTAALLAVADRKLAALLQSGEDAGRDATGRGAAGGGTPRAGGAAQPRGNASVSAADTRPATEASLREIQLLAEQALRTDPHSARAYRVLGQVAELSGDLARADKLMQLAVRNSQREMYAVYWSMMRSFAARDFARTVSLADTLLRIDISLAEHVTPVLAQIAETPAGVGALKALLATDPSWRSQFFYFLPRSITDPRTPVELMLLLKDTTRPGLPADVANYLRHLIQRRHYDIAYYTWLQFLPPEQLGSTGHLFNGSFEMQPSGLPFDWQIASGPGVTVEIAPRPGETSHKALHIEFGQGRAELSPIAQTVMLGPGTYRLTGAHRGQVEGRRGLRWRVSCLPGGGAALGESRMLLGAMPTWRTVEMAFTVPPEGCPAQQVRLELDARSASEQLVTGDLWADDVRIERIQVEVALPAARAQPR